MIHYAEDIAADDLVTDDVGADDVISDGALADNAIAMLWEIICVTASFLHLMQTSKFST